MAAWNDGYIFDVAYTSGFYREIAPGWMAAAAMLLGHRPPDLSRPFRYAELGCGHGLSLNVFAASNPNGAFHGFDFNPAHVESGRRMATRAGLSNVHFHEMSFGDLAEAPTGSGEGRFQQFDFIVAHGIWSWVSPAVRQQMAASIRRHLAPGGLLYVSYNNLAGWASLLPVQKFMLEWSRVHPGSSPERTQGAINFVREMAKAEAAFFPANPAVAARLDATNNMDPRYLAHEYLNANWDPTTFAQVADVLGEAKVGYIGSATLIENIDAVAVPPNALKLMQGTTDQRLREMMRDFGANRSFRRDLYRRGTEQPPSGEQREMLDAIHIVGTGREKEQNIQIPTGIGQLGLRQDIYGPILERLAQGPMTLAELRQTKALSPQPLSETLQAVAFLMTGGLAHPTLGPAADPAAVATARALNGAIAAANAAGAANVVLASPLTGSGVPADFAETLILPEIMAGRGSAEALVDYIIGRLAHTGRSVVKDGKPVTDQAAARTEMAATVTRLMADREGLWKRLGLLPA
jgi:SAM-dependent methyltransferase